jgi:hypothetical protein
MKIGMQRLVGLGLALIATSGAAAADKPVFGLVMSFSGWFQPIDADTIAGAKLASTTSTQRAGCWVSRSRSSSSTTNPILRSARTARSTSSTEAPKPSSSPRISTLARPAHMSRSRTT